MIKYDMSMLNGNKYVDQLLDITRNSFEEILFALESTSLTFGGKRLYFSANAFFFFRAKTLFFCAKASDFGVKTSAFHSHQVETS